MSSENYENLKDEEILAYSLESPHLFEIILARYQDPFLRTAQRVVKSREEAEDVCQEAFVKIYLNGRKFKKQPGASFKSWAYKILMNTAFVHYRKLKRNLNDLSYRDDILADEKILNLAGADYNRNADEIKDIVEKILAEMPEDLQSVLRQHYLEDKSYKMMAAANNTTLGAIRMKIFRARKLFKELLSFDSL